MDSDIHENGEMRKEIGHRVREGKKVGGIKSYMEKKKIKKGEKKKKKDVNEISERNEGCNCCADSSV